VQNTSPLAVNFSD